MVHGKNRIPYWIDRRLTGLAGPEYHAIISFGLPIEPEDSQYGNIGRNGHCRPKCRQPSQLQTAPHSASAPNLTFFLSVPDIQNNPRSRKGTLSYPP